MFQMEQLKQTILEMHWQTKDERRDKRCSHYLVQMMKDAPGRDFLSAGNFFTISYPFTAQVRHDDSFISLSGALLKVLKSFPYSVSVFF